MLLAIDIGNTDAVFAVFKEEELQKTWRIGTSLLNDHEKLRQSFDKHGISSSDIEDIIISSVVPKAEQELQAFCGADLGHDPIIVSNKLVGIPINIDRPEELGSDRIVNAVAVLEHYSAPAIVIDFGTATTFDVIDADGSYSGGVIAPGVNLSVTALHQATAKLPHIEIVKSEKVVGKDTVSAIQSGIYWGYVGLVEGIVQRIESEIGVKPFILATGGLARLFADNLPFIEQVDNELTLKGLLKIYQDYKKT